jgi:hypothetical protein
MLKVTQSMTLAPTSKKSGVIQLVIYKFSGKKLPKVPMILKILRILRI